MIIYITICLIIIIRNIIACKIANLMYNIAIKEKGRSEWFLNWYLAKFVFLELNRWRPKKYVACLWVEIR